MQRILWFIFFFLLKITVSAQSTSNITESSKKFQLIYCGIGGGFGITSDITNGGSLVLNTTCVGFNNWGVAIDYNYFRRSAKNKPGDYRPDFVQGIFNAIAPGNEDFHDQLNSFQLSMVKEFPSRLPYLRFGLVTGVGICNLSRMTFTRIPNPCNLCTNYTVSRTNYTSPLLHFKLRIIIPAGDNLGFEMLLHGNINKYESYYGAALLLNFGRVREKKKQTMVETKQ